MDLTPTPLLPSDANMRLRDWLTSHPDVGSIDGALRFVPRRKPFDLGPGPSPLWKIPGTPMLSRPYRLIEATLNERRTNRARNAYGRDGLIFVRVPKNASTSIADGLRSGVLGHATMQKIRWVVPKHMFAQSAKFAVVREPRQRLVSAFNYLKYGNLNARDMRFRDTHLARYDEFSAFVNALRNRNEFDRLFRWAHFRDQCQFVADPRGRLLVDCVISMERLDLVKALVHTVAGYEPTIGHRNPSPGAPLPDVDWSLIDEYYAHDRRLYELAQGGGVAIC